MVNPFKAARKLLAYLFLAGVFFVIALLNTIPVIEGEQLRMAITTISVLLLIVYAMKFTHLWNRFRAAGKVYDEIANLFQERVMQEAEEKLNGNSAPK